MVATSNDRCQRPQHLAPDPLTPAPHCAVNPVMLLHTPPSQRLGRRVPIDFMLLHLTAVSVCRLGDNAVELTGAW